MQHNKKGLRHLAIDGEEHYVLAVLRSMMTLLGPLIHQHTSKSIPYSRLERLEVSLQSTEGGDMVKCYSEASSHLAPILQHQRAINSLSLQSWPLSFFLLFLHCFAATLYICVPEAHDYSLSPVSGVGG